MANALAIVHVSCAQLKIIASLTLEVKNQVKHTLEKAQKKKQHFETSNRKLKDFIQKIRDFLMGKLKHLCRDWPVAGEVANIRMDMLFSSTVQRREQTQPALRK